MPLRISNTLRDVVASVGMDSIFEEDTNEADQVVSVFITQADERVRPSHAALHNTVWDINDPERPIPPLDFGCRCREEFRAKRPSDAVDTGLPPAPKKPPEPGKEALEGFWNEAEQSEQSVSPGNKVTPVDTFGKIRGTAIEAKEITPDQAFGDDGDVLPALEVENVVKARAAGRSIRSVITSTASLESFGISTSSQQRVIKLARETLEKKPTLKDEQALFDAVMTLKPGRVASLNPVTTRKNARRVAKLLRKTFGPLVVIDGDT